MQQRAKEVGFVVEKSERAVTIEGREKSYMQKRSADSLLGRDLVLNMSKPKHFLVSLPAVPLEEGRLMADEGREEAAVEILKEFVGEREAVPYSELFEHYLYKVAAKPRRALEELLADYFVPSPGGWRNPKTGVEEKRLAEEWESGIRKRIGRFLKALDEGRLLPSAEMPDDEILAQWLHYAYESGMWREGVRLYEEGGIALDAFSASWRHAIREDYETCRMMSERSEAKGGAL